MGEAGRPVKNTNAEAVVAPSTSDPGATISSSAAAALAEEQRLNQEIIGPYRLIRKLGEGGMGQVWLAEQAEPIQRLVALKLIKVGRYDDSVLRRFYAERQSLAMMEHPTIAKVFDAGATPDGQPYFVMEYVRGEPITDYSDCRRLKIRERLELFIKVCEGVQHAHQKAVMHRDLKPANILVVEVDGKPVPRIIDFGLAKAASPQLGDETLVTLAGGWVGTPGYMSPEQADPGVVDVDTRTDVYSLGAVLYVLLTGFLPFDGKDWHKQRFDEFLRRLREEDPSRPSTKVSTSEETSKAIAEVRATEPKHLVSLLHGDLDWITMKALEKDRGRRYGTPMELAADIGRYLNNEPIVARPASTVYRVRKYVGRHRLGVTFAATAALLFIALVATLSVQNIRIARERDLAEKNRAEATKQAQLALDTIYKVVTHADDQLRNLDGTRELRKQLMQDAMKNLDQISRNAATANWADRTMGVALQRMGDFYEQMGMATQQEQVYNQALSIFRRLQKEQPDEQWIPWNIAVSLDILGGIANEEHSDAAVALSDFKESFELRQQLVRDVHQPQPPLPRRWIAVGVSGIKLSNYSLQLGDPGSALKYAEQARPAFLAAVDAGASAKDISQFFGLVDYLIGQASLPVEGEAKARASLLRSIETRMERSKADSLDAGAKRDLQSSEIAMGDLEIRTGNPAAAMEQYNKAVQIMEFLLEKDPGNEEDQWYMAGAEYAMGVAQRQLGKKQEAAANFQKCLKLRRGLLETEPKSTQRRTELMLVEAQLGQDKGALEEANKLREMAPKHPGILFSGARAYAICAAGAALEPSQNAKTIEYENSAVKIIEQAVANGYDVRLLDHDPDLQGIQRKEGFERLLNAKKTR
jgi:serine/threonine protein kinase/tetratricopeptide (TPR) repeat protein